MKDEAILQPDAATTLSLPADCLSSSWNYCRRLTRRARSSFPIAFRLLPPPKRDAMTALYAFFRVTDDLADGPGKPSEKRRALADWRTGLRLAMDGYYSHRLHAALHHVVVTFGVPPEMLESVIDGAEADLDPVRFDTFAELYPYCYRVASSVGIACVHVWGFRQPSDREPAIALAEQAGIAFQLTNILRDLREDRECGRIYLPAEELARFGCSPDRWERPESSAPFRELMRFQVARARDFYRRSEPLADRLTPEGRAIFHAMSGLYRRLLEEIERRDYDVFTRRVRVGKLAKLRVLASAWLGKSLRG